MPRKYHAEDQFEVVNYLYLLEGAINCNDILPVVIKQLNNSDNQGDDRTKQ